VQLVIQIPALVRLGVLRWPRWNLKHEAVGRIARLMGPAIIGSSMGQLSIMLSTAIASLLVDGSMSWLFFADRIVEFPLGVFSIALATVILPSLSAHHARETPEEFSATLVWALRLVSLIVIPASMAMLVPNVAIGLMFPWSGATAGTAFASGYIDLRDMIRVGFFATLVLVVVTASVHILFSGLL